MRLIWTYAVLVALISALPTNAMAWCVEPVRDGGASENGYATEKRHNLLVRRAKTLPGYPSLLLQKGSHSERWTIRDNRFAPLGDPVGNNYSGFHQFKNGTIVTGVNSGGTYDLYQFTPGNDGFIDTSVGSVLSIRYDAGRDIMFLRLDDDKVMEWDGENLRPSALISSIQNLNDTLPTFLPRTDLYLQSTKDGLFSFKSMAPDQRYRVGGWWGHWFRFQTGSAVVSNDGSFVALRRAARRFRLNASPPRPRWGVFQVRPNGALRYRYSVRASRIIRLPDGPLLTTPGLSDARPVTYFLYPKRKLRTDTGFLTRQAAQHTDWTIWPENLTPGIAYDVPLVHTKNGWSVFNGTATYPIADPDGVLTRKYPVMLRRAGHIYFQHKRALYRLQPDHALRKVSGVPDEPGQRVELFESNRFGGVFAAVYGNGVWHAPDGQNFEHIAFIGQQHLVRLIADIPDTSAILMLTKDGLLSLRASCGDVNTEPHVAGD